MTRALDRALLQSALLARLADANLLVNGFHTISQETGTALKTGSGAWVVDQFCTAVIPSITAQQVASPFPSLPDIAFGTKLTAPSVVALGAADAIVYFQPIEGLNLARLKYGASAARPVTIAFVLRPNYSGVATFGLLNLTTTKSILKRLNLIANQDNFFCFTLPGDQVDTLALGAVGSLQARWCFGAGTSYQSATLEAWTAGNFCAQADTTNMAAVAGQSVAIGACVMVPGRFSLTQDQLPLLARRIDDELRLCMRYWQFNPFCYGSVPNANNQTLVKLQNQFPVPMRTTPSLTLLASGTFMDMPYVQSIGGSINSSISTGVKFGVVMNVSAQSYGYTVCVESGSFSCNARM